MKALGLIWTSILVGASAVASAQDASISADAKTNTSVMKVCSDENPPPCATAPRGIKTPDPKYTNEARKAKIQGSVTLRVVVGADGRTHGVSVVHPLDPGLDQNAMDTVRKWKFQPATYEGHPTNAVINVIVTYRLFDKDTPLKSLPFIPGDPDVAKQFAWKIDAKTYTSDFLGMKITIPEHWELLTQHSGSNIPKSAVFGKPASLANVVLVHEHLEVSAGNYLRLNKNSISQQAGFTMLGESAIKRDGIDGTRWNFIYKLKDVPLRAVMEIFSVGDEHFRIFAFAPADAFDRYSGDLTSATQSVSFPGMHVDPKEVGH